MNKKQYAVLIIPNADAEPTCTLFHDCEKAKAYLNWIWEEYYNEEIAEDSNYDPEECYHEDDYARLSWTDGSYTEFVLTEVSEPNTRFIKEYRK